MIYCITDCLFSIQGLQCFKSSYKSVLKRVATFSRFINQTGGSCVEGLVCVSCYGFLFFALSMGGRGGVFKSESLSHSRSCLVINEPGGCWASPPVSQTCVCSGQGCSSSVFADTGQSVLIMHLTTCNVNSPRLTNGQAIIVNCIQNCSTLQYCSF